MENNKNPFKGHNEDNQNEEIKEATEEVEETEKTAETQDETNEEVLDKTQDEKSDETAKLKKQLEDLNNKYIRLAADFENFRKRTAQEKEELATHTTVQVLSKITTVLDTFERAQQHLQEIDNCQTVKEGYEVAIKQFVDILKKLGMEEIEAIGKEFDPNEHEAITKIPTDEFEPDTIAVVAQKGYKLKDKIIRPALVGVAKKKDEHLDKKQDNITLMLTKRPTLLINSKK